MQKTAELLESAIKRIEELLGRDDISHELQSACLSIRDHLKADLAAAQRAVPLQAKSDRK